MKKLNQKTIPATVIPRSLEWDFARSGSGDYTVGVLCAGPDAAGVIRVIGDCVISPDMELELLFKDGELKLI